LPEALIAVDKRHLVALANQLVTEVRQRVPRPARPPRHHRDPFWLNRRLLLTGAEHLSTKQWSPLRRTLDRSDPTNEIGAACRGSQRWL